MRKAPEGLAGSSVMHHTLGRPVSYASPESFLVYPTRLGPSSTFSIGECPVKRQIEFGKILGKGLGLRGEGVQSRAKFLCGYAVDAELFQWTRGAA